MILYSTILNLTNKLEILIVIKIDQDWNIFQNNVDYFNILYN